jgi:O-methyltransferase domain
MAKQDPVDPQLVNEVAKISSLMGPWAIRVAATLRLPDLVADGVTRPADLAERTGSNPDALGRLMRYLTELGVFREEKPGEYAVTAVGEFFKDDHPMKLRAFSDQNGFGAKLDEVISHLGETIRTGKSNYESVFGKRFWADQDDYPDPSLSFNSLMAEHTRWFGADIRKSYDWESSKMVVDVGGGTGAGTFLAELLTAYPHLQAILVEDPQETAKTAAEALAGVAGRVTTVTQSLFDPMPSGGDTYVLTNIIRNWPDDDAARILRGCADAAGASGRILVVERILTDDDFQIFVADANLRILMLLGGRERRLEDWRDLGRRAGLRLVSTTPTAYSHMYLIEYAASED